MKADRNKGNASVIAYRQIGKRYLRNIGSLICAAIGMVALLSGISNGYAFIAQSDSADFAVNTINAELTAGGAGHGDSANFTLNIAFGTPVAVGGASFADSANFTISTRGGTVLAIGGASFADSADFTVSSKFGTVAAVGGTAFADSGNFTVSTRAGTVLAIGGECFADSGNFTLNTGGTQPSNTPTSLTFMMNGSNLVISWPTSAGNYSLQSTTNLNPPNWTNVANLPSTVGSNYVSTNGYTQAQEFFRLKSN